MTCYNTGKRSRLIYAVREYRGRKSQPKDIGKTELELGRCLRLPQEGPCECDLYLTCAKFVTTPHYAPRLRERLCTEQQLVTDAESRGWDREVQRHQRIISLLDDLGEPHAEL
ncbi:hypothetical protein HEP85_38930 [Streptomyces sp. RPA4-2]|uniref:hypothetical protein n=1 Tax=Streptomyces sp. RPA4-2 TaxID=2721244 RepID=UPI001B3C8C86|nr:hypothetical protein [Streptomyces sp. RPA4-2]